MAWTCENCGGDLRKPVYRMAWYGNDVEIVGQPAWECLNCGRRSPRRSRKSKQIEAQRQAREALLQELLAKKEG